MSNVNDSQTSFDEDMEVVTHPRSKRGRPNDSPDPKDRLLSKDIDTCGHCKKKCTPTCEALQCDLCSSWVHASCEGFSKKQYSSMSQLTKSLDNVMFYCRLNNCVTRSKQFIFANIEATQTASDDTLQSLTKEQDTIRQTLTQLSEKVNELCCANQTLSRELKSGSTPLNQAPQSTSVANSLPSNPGEVVEEYLDRERRKTNLIVYNLQEPNNVQTTSERSEVDKNNLTQLFHSELRIEDVEITKCIRLGKTIQNKARPVLITIPNSNKRSSILRSASSLRKSEHHKDTFISPDMTPREREAAKELRAELRRRKSHGEVNIIIRRGKIVTVNPRSTSAAASVDVSANTQTQN